MKTTISEEIEKGLRRSKQIRQDALDSIRAQCQFVKASSTDKALLLFADVIDRIAEKPTKFTPPY